jgi:hypothetical protein
MGLVSWVMGELLMYMYVRRAGAFKFMECLDCYLHMKH